MSLHFMKWSGVSVMHMSHPLARVPNAALPLEWLIGQGAISFWRETRLTLACFWGCWGGLSVSASHRYLARVSGKPACSMVNLAKTNRCWFRRSVFRWSLAIRQTATLINFIQTVINRYYQQISSGPFCDFDGLQLVNCSNYCHWLFDNLTKIFFLNK